MEEMVIVYLLAEIPLVVRVSILIRLETAEHVALAGEVKLVDRQWVDILRVRFAGNSNVM